ncbi:2-amino-3-carboxymuconate-6-semialdehyde decarboxylase, putative [Cordyceps militaris CM01]|uniref:2-amino-3-carboxymuconate-6-semialdehyde decarboxylase, putative n=1 Tax=Cordyceps militaris (strain CM01) TaxID=983644 RepID=G3J549_CORMM|nr:2-amino-3-carboxymuconate-6-semialdehyde decarboxylase, putative [Cordyceps militaris CM01]EGX95963.1 2-amino-3-carboxymuconate-6-semialdehyde decarboxylase, putative [Cordyceps militaris CM01]
MRPLIALEEHFASPAVIASSADAKAHYAHFPPHILDKLTELGETRVADLDKGHVSLQVVSHGPGNVGAAVCTTVNDELAAAVRRHPTRLAGFAMLPMREPDAAADELERCVATLGFVGALLENHLDGVFYDAEAYWPVFARAERLDVPLYIHPTFASDAMADHYQGNYPDSVALALSAFGWGWHAETGHHILRLFAAGLFDRFPKLKIVIGHMGEMLPFQLDRCIAISERWGAKERGLRQVWRENIWVTTSGMFTLTPLKCLLETMPIDHVLYSVDYPFSANEKGFEFLNKIEKSGLITGEDLDLFAYKNAENLLRVKAAPNQDATR